MSGPAGTVIMSLVKVTLPARFSFGTFSPPFVPETYVQSPTSLAGSNFASFFSSPPTTVTTNRAATSDARYFIGSILSERRCGSRPDARSSGQVVEVVCDSVTRANVARWFGHYDAG